MSAYAINPPNTPLVDSQGRITPEWYRYLVRNKSQGDGLTDASVITFDDATNIFPNARSLEVAAGEITETGGSGSVTLGLADTAVTPNTYGDASHVIAITVDQKGRIVDAHAFPLNSDNVTEGTTNLFFTQARARASVSGSAGVGYNGATGVFALDQAFARGLISGGSGINYNSGTGAIATSGFSGTGVYTNFTFTNGVCTAAS